MNQKLTDRQEIASISEDALIHIVEPNDPSQSPEGSSYKFPARKLFMAGQDNIDIKVPFTYTEGDSDADILDVLNNVPQYVVSDTQSVWFVGVNSNGGEPITLKLKMFNKGKGTYGVGGTQLTIEDVELVYKGPVGIADIEDDPTTQTVNYGTIAVPVSQWLNERNPGIAIQAQTDGYTIFKGTVSGVESNYLWVGAPGVYGVGESQSTEADFQILGGVTTPTATPDATPTVKGKMKLAGDFDPTSTADNPIIKTASSTVAGKTKMYTDATGTNEDGGVTQKAVKEALDIKATKEGTTSTPSDLSTVYRGTWWNKLGNLVKLSWIFANDTTKELTIDGPTGQISPAPGVADWSLKTLLSGTVAWRVLDDIGTWFSVGTTGSGKRVYNLYAILRQYNNTAVANNENEFISVDCASTTSVQLLKAITLPSDSTITIDVLNINSCNTDNVGLKGRAHFFARNVSGTVTDTSVDAYRYTPQYSFIKTTPGSVTSSDARIDISVSGNVISINFINQNSKLTTIQCKIEYSIVNKPS